MKKDLIVVASNNKGKIQEIQNKFEPLGIICVGMEEYLKKDLDIDETGETFEENAKIKAIALSELIEGSQWVLADDSGLLIEAMPNELGVKTARFRNDIPIKDRFNLILDECKNVNNYNAKFVCVLVAISPFGEMIVVEGEEKGLIVEPKVDGGFAYDPIFYYPPYEKTNAEMTTEEKNTISHRGIALDKMYEELKK